VIELRGQPPGFATAGSVLILDVEVGIRGPSTWPVFSDVTIMQVGLMATWWRDGQKIQGLGQFIRLPRNVGSRERVAVRARIKTPAQTGDYELELFVTQVLAPGRGRVGDKTLRFPMRIDS
jgi:hypothetical protein